MRGGQVVGWFSRVAAAYQDLGRCWTGPPPIATIRFPLQGGRRSRFGRLSDSLTISDTVMDDDQTIEEKRLKRREEKYGNLADLPHR
jgi:hypothetical protein